jgi:hypothetical protein
MAFWLLDNTAYFRNIIRMPRTLDEERRRVPEDWGLPHTFHGFTRNHKYHDYIVQMRVGRRIVQFARVKDAKLAAQLYDVALWKLAPFTPPCAKPNFPNEFRSITQIDVDEQCPLANRYYDQALKEIEAAGITLQSLQDAKSQRLSALTVDIADGAKTDYAKLMRAVHEIHKQAVVLKFKLASRRAKVGLLKFPDITRRTEIVNESLATLAAESSGLIETLIDHQELFQKLRPL